MYNSNYEEYMQNVLGYSIMPRNTYQMQEDIYSINEIERYSNEELERLYPDTYRMIYPMVQKVCMRANGGIDEKLINDMTTEVYNAMVETRTSNNTQNVKNSTEQRSSIGDKKKEETRQQNFMLNDLIRILIIRELLMRRRPPMPPPRPPMGRPPRPPMGPKYPREIGYPVM